MATGGYYHCRAMQPCFDETAYAERIFSASINGPCCDTRLGLATLQAVYQPIQGQIGVACSLLFVVAEEGVGKGRGTGDCPSELMLNASKGRLEVAPGPTPADRVVLPMALAERVDPRKARPLVTPYSASASSSRSSALKTCCASTSSIT